MGGIVLNEDCCHFLDQRFKIGTDVGIKELHEFIDQYAGTQVKEFVMNISSMIAFFPSKSRENVIDKYLELCQDPAYPQDKLAGTRLWHQVFIGKGLDMHKIWIGRLREHGISPWISIRMNDIHYSNDDSHFLITQFYRDHKHMRRGAHRPYSIIPDFNCFDDGLDYMYEEVREHYLSLIREIAGRYDMDGLEIDWMRGPFTLGIGSELDGRNILTGFMHTVRDILDDAEKIWGHGIKICARVPQSPEMAMRSSFDVIEWARSGIVDVIVPTAHWATTDNDMPIDFWKQILEGTGVMLCAGIEILLEATRKKEKDWMSNSLETVRGSAAAYLGMGADRIYLFNYMSVLCPENMEPNTDDSPELEEYSAVNPKNYRTLLTTSGELETIGRLPRRHVVTYHDIAAPGTRAGDLLPVRCGPPGKDGRCTYHDIRVATGPVEADADIRIIIGIDKDMDEGSGRNDDIDIEFDASDISVFINSKPCIFEGSCLPPQPRPSCRFYSFKVQNHAGFPEASVIEMAAKKKPLTVVWLEICVT